MSKIYPRSEELDHLPREDLALLEPLGKKHDLGDKDVVRHLYDNKNNDNDNALGKKHDLSDEAVVGHHHGDGPEQCLEIVRQLGPSGVPI